MMKPDRYHPLRRLASPQAVLIDPRRTWVMPAGRRSSDGKPAIGIAASSLDPCAGNDWLPAMVNRWARLRFGGVIGWYAEVIFVVSTSNDEMVVEFRQWVPEDAVSPVE